MEKIYVILGDFNGQESCVNADLESIIAICGKKHEKNCNLAVYESDKTGILAKKIMERIQGEWRMYDNDSSV